MTSRGVCHADEGSVQGVSEFAALVSLYVDILLICSAVRPVYLVKRACCKVHPATSDIV